MNNIITTVELHSLKELLMLRKTIRDRMNTIEAAQNTLHDARQDTIEHLTLGQILVRLPQPSQITLQTCTEGDILTWGI